MTIGTTTRVLTRMGARLLLAAAVAVIMAVVGLSLFGLPRRWTHEVLTRMATGDYALECEAVRLDLLRGVILEGVRVFRKQVVGPPIVEARRIAIRFNLFAALRGEAALRRVSLMDGVIRPAMNTLPRASKPSEARGPASFTTMLDIGNCVVDGVTIERFRSRLTLTPGRVTLAHIDAVLRRENLSGVLRGEVRVDTGEKILDGSFISDFDPHLLLPLMDRPHAAFLRTLIGRFEFSGPPPHVEFTFRRGLDPTNDFVRVTAKARLEDLCYQGEDVRRSDGTVDVFSDHAGTVCRVDPLVVVRRDGMASGGFTVDTVRGTVAFEAQSTIRPDVSTRLIGVLTNGVMDDYHFDGTTTITAGGIAALNDPDVNDFHVEVSAHNMAWQWFRAEESSWTLQVKGRTLTVTNLIARAYGGTLNGAARFDFPPPSLTNTSFLIEGTLRDADFLRLATDFRGRRADEALGKLGLALRLSGVVPDPERKAVSGEGRVWIDDGRIFSFPIFGGFTEIMTRIVPGLDFVLRQTRLKSDFTLGHGGIETEKISVEGDVLSLAGQGRYAFDGTLDFNVQAYLMREHTLVSKVLRALTYPISKLFEFKLRGTLDEPRWYPEHFSSDMLKRLGFPDREKKE